MISVVLAKIEEFIPTWVWEELYNHLFGWPWVHVNNLIFGFLHWIAWRNSGWGQPHKSRTFKLSHISAEDGKIAAMSFPGGEQQDIPKLRGGESLEGEFELGRVDNWTSSLNEKVTAHK